MIDIHAHILPGIDDGSQSVAESVQMLDLLARQGVKFVAATPHFYASDQSPSQFLRHRRHAAQKLLDVWQPNFPSMALGAEVQYFNGISRIDELDQLKLEQTPLLLLEMPFSPWTGRMVDEVQELQSRPNTVVLLAHIERYLAMQKSEVWRTLLDSGVKMQCNASFFLRWNTKRKALQMLRSGQIHFIGSDCHNMTNRPPRMDEAMAVIDKALGRSGRRILTQKAAETLTGVGH